MVVDNILFLALVFFLIVIAGWLYVVSQNTRTAHRKLRQVSEQHTLINADERARQLCIAIHQLHPGMQAGVDFIIRHDAAGGAPHIAEWYGSQPKPTQTELDAAFSRVSGKSYAELRRAEYPSIGDQMDAAYKARLGDNAEQVRLDKLITDIKLKYPKTGACN